MHVLQIHTEISSVASEMFSMKSASTNCLKMLLLAFSYRFYFFASLYLHLAYVLLRLALGCHFVTFSLVASFSCFQLPFYCFQLKVIIFLHQLVDSMLLHFVCSYCFAEFMSCLLLLALCECFAAFGLQCFTNFSFSEAVCCLPTFSILLLLAGLLLFFSNLLLFKLSNLACILLHLVCSQHFATLIFALTTFSFKLAISYLQLVFCYILFVVNVLLVLGLVC